MRVNVLLIFYSYMCSLIELIGVFSGLIADGQAEVMFVDYGNNEYTDRDALKVIKPQFMSLPAQAVQCRLSGNG